MILPKDVQEDKREQQWRALHVQAKIMQQELVRKAQEKAAKRREQEDHSADKKNLERSRSSNRSAMSRAVDANALTDRLSRLSVYRPQR